MIQFDTSLYFWSLQPAGCLLAAWTNQPVQSETVHSCSSDVLRVCAPTRWSRLIPQWNASGLNKLISSGLIDHCGDYYYYREENSEDTTGLRMIKHSLIICFFSTILLKTSDWSTSIYWGWGPNYKFRFNQTTMFILHDIFFLHSSFTLKLITQYYIKHIALDPSSFIFFFNLQVL